MFKDLAVERVNPRTKVIYKSYYHKYKGFDYFYDVFRSVEQPKTIRNIQT